MEVEPAGRGVTVQHVAGLVEIIEGRRRAGVEHDLAVGVEAGAQAAQVQPQGGSRSFPVDGGERRQGDRPAVDDEGQPETEVGRHRGAQVPGQRLQAISEGVVAGVDAVDRAAQVRRQSAGQIHR